MIEFMSSWVKGLGLAIVMVSILEMLLPNNKTKKYIRMVMGIYILFTIISPFVSNQEVFDGRNLDFENYVTTQETATLNQSSMDQRIKQLYIQELEKDITKKLTEKGFEVQSCKVKAQISNQEEETKITKIKLTIQKAQLESINPASENKQNIEEQVVTQIQKIKPIDTSIKKENNLNSNDSVEATKNMKISKVDIQNVKKFLIQEYEVNEKCLEIN